MTRTFPDFTLSKSKIPMTELLYKDIMDGIPMYTFFNSEGKMTQPTQSMTPAEKEEWNNNLIFNHITRYADEALVIADAFEQDMTKIAQTPGFKEFCRQKAKSEDNPAIKKAWEKGDFRTALAHTYEPKEFKHLHQGVLENVITETVEPALIHLNSVENTYRALVDSINEYNSTNLEKAFAVNQTIYAYIRPKYEPTETNTTEKSSSSPTLANAQNQPEPNAANNELLLNLLEALSQGNPPSETPPMAHTPNNQSTK